MTLMCRVSRIAVECCAILSDCGASCDFRQWCNRHRKRVYLRCGAEDIAARVRSEWVRDRRDQLGGPSYAVQCGTVRIRIVLTVCSEREGSSIIFDARTRVYLALQIKVQDKLGTWREEKFSRKMSTYDYEFKAFIDAIRSGHLDGKHMLQGEHHSFPVLKMQCLLVVITNDLLSSAVRCINVRVVSHDRRSLLPGHSSGD